MDGVLRPVCVIGRYKRVACLTITSVCMVCSIPLNGACIDRNESSGSQKLVTEILFRVNDPNSGELIEEFDKFEEIFDGSTDPFAEGRKFLETFINEVNSKYALNLTIQDACRLVRENMHKLQLPEEFQRVILNTIELFESDPTPPNANKEAFVRSIKFHDRLADLIVHHHHLEDADPPLVDGGRHAYEALHLRPGDRVAGRERRDGFERGPRRARRHRTERGLGRSRESR